MRADVSEQSKDSANGKNLKYGKCGLERGTVEEEFHYNTLGIILKYPSIIRTPQYKYPFESLLKKFNYK